MRYLLIALLLGCLNFDPGGGPSCFEPACSGGFPGCICGPDREVRSCGRPIGRCPEDQVCVEVRQPYSTAYCFVPPPPPSDAAPADAAAPDASLPDAPAHWTFTSAADIAAWLAFTNCSGCQLGTFAVVSASFARLVSNDLPCTGGCMYPGSYALSPQVAVPADGHVVLRFAARSSAPDSQILIQLFDAGGGFLTQEPVAVEQSAGFVTNGTMVAVPAGAARAAVRLDVLTPFATLDVASIDVERVP